ncbi:probable LRR receptor-like serine/threonine-protein kinase At3g47570 [Lycium barbarum]|uniref:probable LRR receptor-like serine/threonine-protein kinase At3g47570 n=1 Tax=Lycium barbarum TaxID=112863 RepID=UPI00293E5CC0|nr:probable LRR receptor-like serine/threonine-protein kinase At3g47570 [Lycium barbarum]
MDISCNLLFALVVFILFHHHNPSLANISTDEAALLALKSHISSHSNNIIARNWTSSSPVCSWIGITCSSRHHRVTALDVSNMQLHGTIPPHLGTFHFSSHSIIFKFVTEPTLCAPLEEPIFRENSIFPSNLTKLEVLRIQSNFLKGEIPRELGDLRYLTTLDLQHNQLSGSIPPSIFNITTMQVIALSDNNLTGKLPTTICDHLPNLEGLYFSQNS